MPNKRPPKPLPADSIFHLHLELEDISPPIYRRLATRACSLLELHDLIQVIMGWENYHLWVFETSGGNYGPDPDPDLDWKDAAEVTLADLQANRITKFSYIYDMGDNWTHHLRIEKVAAPDPQMQYPCCLEGARACPPEDCGGPWGYEELLAAQRDSSRPDHAEMMEWCGALEPEHFDLEAVNRILRPAAKKRKKRTSKS